MLLGYGLALAILRALYVHWRDAWREPDSIDDIFKLIKDACITTYAKRTLPLTVKQRIELTRGFMRRDRDMYGPQHTYRLDNINNLCQLLVLDLDFHRASAWYEYGLRICAANTPSSSDNNHGNNTSISSSSSSSKDNEVELKLARRAVVSIRSFKLAAARFYMTREDHQKALTLLDQVILALPNQPPEDDSHQLCRQILSDRLKVLACLKHEDLDGTAIELLSLVEVSSGPLSEAVLGLLEELLRINLSATTRSRLETHRRFLEEVISVKSAIGDESIYMVQCLEALARFYRFKADNPFHFSTFKPERTGHFSSFKSDEPPGFSAFKANEDIRFCTFKLDEPHKSSEDHRFSSFKQHEPGHFSSFKPERNVCFCSFKPHQTSDSFTFKQDEPEQTIRFCSFKRSEPDYHDALMHKASQIKAINRIRRLPYPGFLDDMELAASFYDERNVGGDKTTAFQLRRRAMLIKKGEIKVRGYTPTPNAK